MSTTTHTPGPWLTADFNAGTMVYVERPETAETKADPDVCHVYPMGFGEREANARLIAAAPELLEALRVVVRILELAHCVDCKCKVCSIARAAIAKAEGGDA